LTQQMSTVDYSCGAQRERQHSCILAASDTAEEMSCCFTLSFEILPTGNTKSKETFVLVLLIMLWNSS